MDLLDRMDENRPIFSSKWTVWTAFTPRYSLFEIARFEVQVLGEELKVSTGGLFFLDLTPPPGRWYSSPRRGAVDEINVP